MMADKHRAIDNLGKACCGCGACVATCPQGCIEMAADGAGFAYPKIGDSKCVGCGACDRACPVLRHGIGSQDVTEAAWWAKSDDRAMLERSSSGGLFGVLAKGVLDADGVVYGATFAEGCKSVHHAGIKTAGQLDAVMRSKYVQSSVGSDVYSAVRADLKSDRQVLYSGVACQIAGLRNYLGGLSNSEHLLCIDVVCHGVPSPKLWGLYVDELNSASGIEIDEVNFRSKSSGWTTYSLLCKRNKEKVIEQCFDENWYMKAFLSNAALRPSCFQCVVKRSCGSDITLGDFWGIQNVHPDVDYEKGVSAILVNTPKGANALRAIDDNLLHGESSFEKILQGNPALVRTVKPYAKYETFMQDLSSANSVGALIDKWSFKPSLYQRMRGFASRARHKLFG